MLKRTGGLDLNKAEAMRSWADAENTTAPRKQNVQSVRTIFRKSRRAFIVPGTMSYFSMTATASISTFMSLGSLPTSTVLLAGDAAEKNSA